MLMSAIKTHGARRAKKRSTFSTLGALALAVVPLAAAVGFGAPKPPARHAPNLVLITMDTTRADHLGAWGYALAHTPNLDALAARGTPFARCHPPAPTTRPSHATILTGLFPPRHGVRDNGTFVLAPKVETLAERLAAHGYDTAGGGSAGVLARPEGV